MTDTIIELLGMMTTNSIHLMSLDIFEFVF